MNDEVHVFIHETLLISFTFSSRTYLIVLDENNLIWKLTILTML